MPRKGKSPPRSVAAAQFLHPRSSLKYRYIHMHAHITYIKSCMSHLDLSIIQPNNQQHHNNVAFREGLVIGIWNGTLPQEIEQKMRSYPTTDGSNIFVDFLSLEQHYYTALTVLAKVGYSRPPSAPEMSDNYKHTAIIVARKIVSTFEPTPNKKDQVARGGCSCQMTTVARYLCVSMNLDSNSDMESLGNT